MAPAVTDLPRCLPPLPVIPAIAVELSSTVRETFLSRRLPANLAKLPVSRCMLLLT